jgi:hypothetical protein
MSYEGEIGHPEAAMSVFLILRRRNLFVCRGIDGDPLIEDALGGSAPAAWASPGAMISYYLYADSLTYSLPGNTEGIALRPVPLGELVAQEGGRQQDS